jgi:hypothetical protein
MNNIDYLRKDFHHLIDEIENDKILEHFLEILKNLKKSEENQKNLYKEMEAHDRLNVAY